jgi:hypothetical protein
MLPEGEVGLDESGTEAWVAERGKESNEAESRFICPAGGRPNCFSDPQIIGISHASPGCQEAAVVEFLLDFIVIYITTSAKCSSPAAEIGTRERINAVWRRRRKACEGHRKNPAAACDQKISHKKGYKPWNYRCKLLKSQITNEFRFKQASMEKAIPILDDSDYYHYPHIYRDPVDFENHACLTHRLSPRFLATLFFPKLIHYEIFRTDQWSGTYKFKVISLQNNFMPVKKFHAGR